MHKKMRRKRTCEHFLTCVKLSSHKGSIVIYGIVGWTTRSCLVSFSCPNLMSAANWFHARPEVQLVEKGDEKKSDGKLTRERSPKGGGDDRKVLGQDTDEKRLLMIRKQKNHDFTDV